MGEAGVHQEQETRAVEAKAGRYLTFALCNEKYGLEILKVVEIIRLMHITRVPRCPDYIKGVINLRGKIIPLMDLRTKFALPEGNYDEKACTIITSVNVGSRNLCVGVIVDTVLEVVEFEASMIEPTPQFGARLDTQFISGLGKRDQNVIILLDIDRVITSGEGNVLATISETN